MRTQRKHTRHIVKLTNGAAWGIVCLLLLIFTLTSCNNDTDSEDTEETHTVPVAFTLSVSDPTSTQTTAKRATRASDDDQWNSEEDREEGTTKENAIDVSRLHVALYNNNGQLISNVSNLTFTQRTTDDTDNKYYDVVGSMNIESGDLSANNTLNGKIVVYANADAPTDGWDNNLDVISGNYTYNYNEVPTYIPMWGFKSLNLTLQSGVTNQLGEIFMLRAMAKVTVKLTDDMINRGYTLDGVTLNNYNTIGYCAPEYSSFSDKENTSVLTMAQTFHLYDTASSTGSLNFALTSNKESTEALYIPEYNNQTQATTTITVRVKHPDGDIREATFDFGNYDTSGNWSSSTNIVRNHHYEFSVYGNPLKIKLTVLPWNVFNHTPYEI